jgi:hypothetical protein
VQSEKLIQSEKLKSLRHWSSGGGKSRIKFSSMLQLGIIVGALAAPTPPGVPSCSLYAGGTSDCEVDNGVAAASLPWSQPSFALAINVCLRQRSEKGKKGLLALASERLVA